MEKLKTRDIQFMGRVILGCVLITAIYIRVDWTVSLFAFLMLIRVEIEDHFINKK